MRTRSSRESSRITAIVGNVAAARIKPYGSTGPIGARDAGWLPSKLLRRLAFEEAREHPYHSAGIVSRCCHGSELFRLHFIKIHRALRLSPAMAAGVRDRPLGCGGFSCFLGIARDAESGKRRANESNCRDRSKMGQTGPLAALLYCDYFDGCFCYICSAISLLEWQGHVLSRPMRGSPCHCVLW
jgi:hypothetical protein